MLFLSLQNCFYIPTENCETFFFINNNPLPLLNEPLNKYLNLQCNLLLTYLRLHNNSWKKKKRKKTTVKRFNFNHKIFHEDGDDDDES